MVQTEDKDRTAVDDSFASPSITLSKAAFDLVLERALMADPISRREGVWNMAYGDLRISFPSKVGVEECGWAEEFVTLVMRGIRRRAERDAVVADVASEAVQSSPSDQTPSEEK